MATEAGVLTALSGAENACGSGIAGEGGASLSQVSMSPRDQGYDNKRRVFAHPLSLSHLCKEREREEKAIL
ncbi:hypothetical protein C0Q70_06296 [Pomacea canaliculata]|uniref:Uncharacterized protein n=1 Tax=Pomacea canaliculata TaxID=400727 RepID=A0A2T7PNL3_POMCA|nr:hypothetical protein C0Q70_06296 [Pomacea canaliculata]